jgi:hypothetical protein
MELESPGGVLRDILLNLLNCQIKSLRGKVYRVSEVTPGLHVVLTSPGRSVDSVLRWKDIERVYEWKGATKDLKPKIVDEILADSKNQESSTMCALVLAMRDPRRIERPESA